MLIKHGMPPFDTVLVVGERNMIAKLSSMMDNNSQAMHETLTALEGSFGDRLHHPGHIQERHHGSLLPIRPVMLPVDHTN